MAPLPVLAYWICSPRTYVDGTTACEPPNLPELGTVAYADPSCATPVVYVTLRCLPADAAIVWRDASGAPEVSFTDPGCKHEAVLAGYLDRTCAGPTIKFAQGNQYQQWSITGLAPATVWALNSDGSCGPLDVSTLGLGTVFLAGSPVPDSTFVEATAITDK